MHALIAHCDEAHSGFQNSPFVHSFSSNSATTVAPVPMKPPLLNVDTTNAGLVGINNKSMDMDIETSAGFAEGVGFQDAPSPYSSVGPETPPPHSFESNAASQQCRQSSSPEIDRLPAPTPLYGSNSLSVFPQFNTNGKTSSPIPAMQRASPYMHSPLASSPLSSGSPASYASGSAGNLDEASIPALQISAVTNAPTQTPADILMHFDPFDDFDDIATPLDSTPPSPLSAPTRVRPVLRHASLVQPVPNCPSIGLPPSLFTTYDYPRSEGEFEPEVDDEERERKEKEREAREKDEERKAARRERDRERRERQRAAERERLAALAAANGESSSSGGKSSPLAGGSGSVVRREREKARKGSATGLAPSPAGVRSVPVSPVVGSFSEERRSSDPGVSSSATGANEMSRAERAAAAASAAQAGANGKKGIREKMYKCMKPGCTKSYLNPNGLKYHTLKGTCTFAEKPNNVASCTATNGQTTPISTTPAASAPGTPAPHATAPAPIALPSANAPTMQLPVPFAIPQISDAAQLQQMQAFAQGFPAFNVSGMSIIAAPMAPTGMTA